MQPARPIECHCPRRAATEAHNISVLRRLIGAVKGVPNSEVDPSYGGATIALSRGHLGSRH
jgi:hypothetical protein